MKPTVFNYQEYERVVEENKKLNAEVADLRIRIADGDKRDCKSCKHQKPEGCSRWNCEYEPVMSDLISRADAIEAIASRDETDGTVKVFTGREVNEILSALPSADRPTTDCTKFMEWLKAEVLDEENWELNAVANGEIICRKFRKLGWLDVEDGYYVDARPTGKWIKSNILPSGWHCSHCDSPVMTDDIEEMLFCPNCGAKMIREDGEDE